MERKTLKGEGDGKDNELKEMISIKCIGWREIFLMSSPLKSNRDERNHMLNAFKTTEEDFT